MLGRLFSTPRVNYSRACDMGVKWVRRHHADVADLTDILGP